MHISIYIYTYFHKCIGTFLRDFGVSPGERPGSVRGRRPCEAHSTAFRRRDRGGVDPLVDRPGWQRGFSPETPMIFMVKTHGFPVMFLLNQSNET